MKILLSEHNQNPETPGILQKEGHEVWIPKEDIPGVHEFGREEFLSLVKEFRPDVLVVGLKFLINKEILDYVGKAVATRTTGLDHISLDYAKEKGIEVLSLRGEDLSDITATAEWTFLNMGMLLRKTGHELKGKNLGLIGSRGRVAGMMDRYAVAFGMNIYYYDKDNDKERLRELLNKSDIVSLHITADEENRNFINKEKFSQMKHGSWFINSSRDWLVDSKALEEATHLAGHWSDFPEHQGGKTKESSQKTETILVNKLLQWLSKS